MQIFALKYYTKCTFYAIEVEMKFCWELSCIIVISYKVDL